MEGHVNTYGGINQDAAYDSIKPNMYIDAKDIRISTDTGESQGAFTNMKGNTLSFVIPIRNDLVPSGNVFPSGWNASSPEVIGYTTIRNSIILFVADDSNTKGWIYEVQYDLATREVDTAVYPKLIYYNELLFFKKEWPIEALGRFENESTQRIYWTDYNNYFRSLNIKEPTLDTTFVGLIDIFPDVKFNQPLLQSVTGGGELNSGEYQIGYRLITFDGKETLVSPPSNLIHIVNSSESLSQSASYVGNSKKDASGKAMTLTVDTTLYYNGGNAEFEFIEFLALYYETATAQPVALSIEQQTISSNLATFLYTGTEGTIIDIELFTFTSKNFAFKTFKSVTQKDNYLVGANIKSSTISAQSLLGPGEELDTRTYRYNSSLATEIPIINDNRDALAHNDTLNEDKHWNPDWHTNGQYKYKANGTTLGGDGTNVSYTFHIEPMTIDGDQAATFGNLGPFRQTFDNHNLDDGYTYTNTNFPNNTSPNISGLLRGYKRGETYRFGIIFYTPKGEATYVEYIGDIKFPDISERDGVNNDSNTKYWPLSTDGTSYGFAGLPNMTVGFNLGIRFNITLPPIFSSKIESYQIVRLDRENNDKRRLCQGMLKTHYWSLPSVNNETPNDYDFRVNGSDNVVHLWDYRRNISDTCVKGASYGSMAFFMDEQNLYSPLLAPFSGVPIGKAVHATGAEKKIRSQHLAFFSPELSYDYNQIKDIASSLASNPCLLMTGHYTTEDDGIDYKVDYQGHIITASGEPLLDNMHGIYDYGYKYRRVNPISFGSIENIKKFKSVSYFDMRDSSNATIDTKTANWLSAANPVINGMQTPSYVRNYFVWHKGVSTTGSHVLNKPNSSGTISFVSGSNCALLNNDNAILARAGTNISVLTDSIVTDYFTNAAIVHPRPPVIFTDYFKIKDHYYFLDTTVTPNIDNSYGIEPYYSSGPLVASAPTTEAIPLADILIPRLEVYGGSTRNALESNVFIPASPIIDKTESSPIVFGGDIFIGMFSCQIAMAELNGEFYKKTGTNDYKDSLSRTDLMATESAINLNLSYGADTSRGVKFSIGTSQERYWRQEDNNDFTNYALKFQDETFYRMYGYDAVFSSANNQLNFFIKPGSLSDLSLTNDVRAYLSAIKVNGENIDSWTKFAINDYYDIDDHGPINKILNFKDDVYFVQDEGIGNYSINREAVTTTDDGVPTELGTAKGWGKHRYLSKEIGSIHQWAVKATNTAIYFFDAIHRKIYMLGAGKTAAAGIQTTPLSELKGMHSFLQELGDGVFARKGTGGDNPILLKGAHIGADEINDEVIFTFLTSNFYGPVQVLAVLTTYAINTLVDVSGIIRLMTSEVTTTNTIEGARSEVIAASTVIALNRIEDTSIVYDELVGQFSTRLSINPKIWINNGDNLMTSDHDPTLSVTTNIYTHNIGNWGEFYGTQEECELTLVINPKADLNKVLRTLEFNSIVRNDDKQITRTETITAFRVKTETQDSGKINYSAGRIKRRFDKWRIKLPRDINSTSQKGRFRSTHFLLTLYFDNTTNKELIMNRLISYYDPQIF